MLGIKILRLWALSALLASWIAAGLAAPRHATVVERESIDASSYDFVIAGGGISGLTLADRLTEDPKVSVLVIEAGPFDQGEDAVLVPGNFNPAPYLWPIVSVPQRELNNGVFLATCARVVGGGSTINAMIFLRGSVQDYDGWTSLGNKGWTWDDLLPYYKKSENFTEPDAKFAAAGNISWIDSAHGFDGPVHNTYPNYFFPGSGNWWEAAKETGITPSPDVNAGETTGLFWLRIAEDARTRTRSYAKINHYDRVIPARPNYHLLANTTVAKLLFEGKRAVGVQYVPTAGGNPSTVHASKEVILAAGALHTPQILQLSGVGPRALLQSFGIEVVSDLPGVGQNFQDQPTIDMSYNFTNNVEPNWNSLLDNATYDAEQRALYDSSKTGPYTIIRTLSTNFASLSLKSLTSSYLDIVSAARSVRDPAAYLPENTDPTVAAGYAAQRKILIEHLTQDVSVGGLHWNTANTGTLYAFRPFSRGAVTINSTDPLANPIVDFRTASDPVDLDVNVAIVRKSRAIMSAPSMRGLGPVELAPFGPEVQTDNEIKAALRQALNPTSAHECCTAAMMPRELGGVLDDQLRVYGVGRLRVVDTSFWPVPISGAPSATAYAAGEKIADMIKKAYHLDGR